MNKMRCLLITGMILIFWSIINTNVYAANKTTNNIDNAYDYAKKILIEYYQAIDQYQEYDFSDDIESLTLLNYINQKIEAKCYKQEVYGEDDMQNYSVDFQLIDSQEIDTNLKIIIVASIDFKYKNADFDSGYKEEIQLILSRKLDRYGIVDWYMPYDDYDTRIRGNIQDISNPYYWGSLLRINDNISNKQEELNDKIKLYYDDLKEQILDESVDISDEQDAITPYTTLYSLNKSNMVTWANNNCTKASPTSGNSNQAPYYDFSKISGNYDCTNFVSHAILAGGAVVYNTGGTGISSTGWYYTSLNKRSSSWSGVANLCSFLTSNTTRGPAGTKKSYSDIYVPGGGNYPFEPGDILQFHNGSVWRHSTLIVGHTAVSGSAALSEAVVTGRTSSTSCNNKVRQSSIYAGEKRRIINLIGYYK